MSVSIQMPNDLEVFRLPVESGTNQSVNLPCQSSRALWIKTNPCIVRGIVDCQKYSSPAVFDFAYAALVADFIQTVSLLDRQPDFLGRHDKRQS